MSDETGEVSIFDADPERVVSVTVGELQKPWTIQSDDWLRHPTVHERMCHMVFIGRVGGVNQWRCDACGCRSSERIISDRLRDPAPAWCHRCGARVIGDDE